jgi:glutamyl-tRNA reductase
MLDIILLGLNHKTAPVALRECMAFSNEDSITALEKLRDFSVIKEVMLFSTCNRVEILLATANKLDAIESVKGFISEFNQVPEDTFANCLYILEGDEAVRHMFRVSSSLDSMVVGEPQILGQIKEAYQLSVSNQTTDIILNRLVQRAFSVAKRVRTETGIGDRAVSISYAAIELGRKIFDTLEGKKALLIGAGEMAEIAVENLLRNKVKRIFVANRTFEHGVALARKFNGHAIRFEEIEDHLKQIDVVISSTGASDFVITEAQVKDTMQKRRNRPLFFIDIAVPRDIDPQINQLPNAYVYDIDDLKGIIEENLEDRQKEAVKAERIVDEAVINFRRWYQSLDITPTLLDLRKKIDFIAQKETDKTLRVLNHLSEKDCGAIRNMIDALTKKILHDPTLFLKHHAREDNKSLVIDITRELFKLDE